MLDPDPLARLLVAPAVLDLGFAGVSFAPAAHCKPFAPAADGVAFAAVFVALGGLPDCRSARRLVGGGGAAAPLLAGYAAGPAALLAAHRAHRCCDLVLRLVAAAGRPRLEHLTASDPVASAGLSVREADVLVLLLRGLTTPAIGEKLCIAPSTARSHCRAVLRKLGASDRRGLRAALLAELRAPAPGSAQSPSASKTSPVSSLG